MAVLSFAASGCGGSPTDEGPPANTGPVKLAGAVTAHGQKTVAGAKPSIEIEADDDYFEPTFLKVDTGATVSVKIENKGMHSHTFTIAALNVDQMLAPGETKTLAFTLPSGPGANFVCKFHGPGGMQGAFYFTDGASFVQGSASTSPTTGSSSDGDSGYNY
jgi:plastocyanin